MGKALFWTAIFFGGIMFARLLAIRAEKKRQPPPQAPSNTGESSNDPEAMVRCAHCGVHLPRSEASLIGQNVWCSAAHAKLGARQHD